MGMGQGQLPYLQDLWVVDLCIHSQALGNGTRVMGIGERMGGATSRTDGHGHLGLSGLNELVTGLGDNLNVGWGLTRLDQPIGRGQIGP